MAKSHRGKSIKYFDYGEKISRQKIFNVTIKFKAYAQNIK